MSHSVGISWTRGRTYNKVDHGFYDRLWKKAKAKSYRSTSEAGYTYWDHVTNDASLAAFHHDPENELISTESLPENSSLIDFRTFAKDYPDKLFPLLTKLRPEFQEIFTEYWVLGKSQSFIADCHGFIQTRVWQTLRIIEQTLGAFILLGTEPTDADLRPILEKENLDSTPYGSLATLIALYASSQSYARVAEKVQAPIPAIRKIFRPIIAVLLKSKNVKAVAAGAYLRNLTHQASLTKVGLSKSCIARTRRVKTHRFVAPPADDSYLLSFGAATSLNDTPWHMFEISSENRMNQLWPNLKAQGKHVFGKKAAQIFAPLNAEGELAFEYIFARSVAPKLTRSLIQIRGISELAATYENDGTNAHAVLVPHIEVQKMIDGQKKPEPPVVKVKDFVEILTGPAAHYCGTITKITRKGLKIEVVFPTERRFIVSADKTCVKLMPKIGNESNRRFWGMAL